MVNATHSDIGSQRSLTANQTQPRREVLERGSVRTEGEVRANYMVHRTFARYHSTETLGERNFGHVTESTSGNKTLMAKKWVSPALYNL